MSTITRKILAERLLARQPLFLSNQRQALSVVDEFFWLLADALASGERIEIREFGVFETVTRQARPGRNPKTGATVAVPARQVVRFRPGKGLRPTPLPPAVLPDL